MAPGVGLAQKVIENMKCRTGFCEILLNFAGQNCKQ